MEFQSRSRRQRGGCRGNNGPGHLSCVAALPFAYNGLGVRPVVAFFSLPSFPGKLLSLTKELLSPLHFFWPTFNPLSLLLFLPLVSASPPKRNTVEIMTIYSSPCGSALPLRPLHVRLCAGCLCMAAILMRRACSTIETEAEDENGSRTPRPRLPAGILEPAHSPLLFWYLQRSDFTTGPVALRSSSPGSSLWHPRRHPGSIWAVT